MQPAPTAAYNILNFPSNLRMRASEDPLKKTYTLYAFSLLFDNYMFDTVHLQVNSFLLTSLLHYSHMYDTFDPYSVCLYMTKATKRLYDIQCLLYQTVITGTQFRGLEILRPPTISQPVRIQSIYCND